MFFDDECDTGADNGWPGYADEKELVRRALQIVHRSEECVDLVSDESAWNNLVHSPLLNMFVYDMWDGPGQDLLDVLPCMTTNISPAYHRFDVAASRVDYVLRLLPKRDPQTTQSDEAMDLDLAPCFNWTADWQLQQYPLAVCIETKRYGGDTVKGEQQVGIWHAAQWEFLTSRAGSVMVDGLGFIPGIVVSGNSWSLVVTMRRGATTTILSSVTFGDTSSIIGVFQTLAGLRRLRKWSLDVLWPWYKKHLPGLCNSELQSEKIDVSAEHPP